MLTMKEMENKTGLSSYTLRYYEKERIIIPQRQANGRRLYSDADVDWIVFVKQLRELDVSIEAVSEYAECVRLGEEGFENRLVFLQAQREKIKEQIKVLQIVEKTLTKQVQLIGNEKKRIQKEKRKQ